MPTRLATAGQRLFSNQAHNLVSLSQTRLSTYLGALPTFQVLLKTLQKQGHFPKQRPVNYTMGHLIAELHLDPKHLALSSVELLQYPAAKNTPPSLDLSTTLPKPYLPLLDPLETYLTYLQDVFDNELAQKDYEAGIPTAENVSEKTHALQAAKICQTLRLPMPTQLAMLFHDIARPTHIDETYSHSQHHQEGHTILAPLNLPITYTLYHPNAKYLLAEFCPPFSSLISPLSKLSLSMQSQALHQQWQHLDTLDSYTLARTLYQLMFLRLIDDYSKTPTLALKSEPQYLKPNTIRIMLEHHLTHHLKLHQDQQSIATLKAQLEKALPILSRAQAHSKHPQLYKQNPKP